MSALRVLGVAAYPFVVYGGLTLVGPRPLAVILGAAFLLRSALWRGALWRGRRSAGCVSPLVGPAVLVVPALLLAGLLGEDRALLLLPSLINAALLVAFGWTLWRGPSMVEVFARRQGDVPPEQLAYCRAVTAIWCVFFVLNGGIALWLAFYQSAARWAFYTGFVAYVLIGALLAAEVAYRRWRFPVPRHATAGRTGPTGG